MWRMMILLVLALAACGGAEVDVQIVDPSDATAIHNQAATQSPNGDGFLFYEHEQSGLFFHYPAAWQIQEQMGRITVSGDGVRLVVKIDAGTSGPPTAPVQPTETGDNPFVESDPVVWLGDIHPTYLDETRQRLYYAIPDENAPFEIANMHVSVWLEGETWPLSPSTRQLADMIVGSMGFRWLVIRPSDAQLAGWQHYTDGATGLQFDYPPGAEVIREPDAIVVNKADAQLILALNGGPSGMPAGELRKGDPTHIWLNNIAVPRVHLLYEDRIKAVYYGPPITPIAIGESTLVISVVGSSSTTYETLDLSPEIRQQMDWIVTTLQP